MLRAKGADGFRVRGLVNPCHAVGYPGLSTLANLREVVLDEGGCGSIEGCETRLQEGLDCRGVDLWKKGGDECRSVTNGLLLAKGGEIAFRGLDRFVNVIPRR